jgi:hypothetical protein
MITTEHAYDETICAERSAEPPTSEARLRKQARELGLQVVAI